MANEKLNVEFPSKISVADNCVCSACHTLGRVVKLELPETLYHNPRKGLSTEYMEYWLCRECRDKLAKALEWGAEDA